jgi:peptidyl-prolyl cis-trans isomerase-like 3
MKIINEKGKFLFDLMSVSLHTNRGVIKLELFCEESPESCRNFLALAASGTYNNTLFHRSIPGFIVQGGDPTGTGKGGKAWNGEMMDNETSALQLKHDRRGIVSLANTPGKPNSVGSQFFITYARLPSLNGQYPVIGRVIDGLDTLKHIEDTPVTVKKNTPVEDIVIASIHIHANPLAIS